MRRLAVDLEGHIVGRDALDLESSGGQVVKVLGEQLSNVPSVQIPVSVDAPQVATCTYVVGGLGNIVEVGHCHGHGNDKGSHDDVSVF